MLKQINKSLKKLLKPKGKINAKDIATMVLLVIVASLAINIILTAFSLLKRWLLPNLNIENFEGKKDFVLLHMDTCPHCVKMMPDWNAASSSNTTSINMKALERKDDGAVELMKKHNVKSFPTMLLLGGGKLLKKYDGGRKKQDFLDFLQKYD
jgi:thioredoxin-related protein